MFDKIFEVMEGEAKRKTVEAAKVYIFVKLAGIMQCIKDKNEEVKCSTEGHISNILAYKMSSRPLGWIRQGADKMLWL